MKECKKTFNIALESELCKVVQGSFNQGNPMFRETAAIQCACMALCMYGIICNFIFNLKES